MQALIPIKSLHNAKSRLAESFSLEERNKLVLQMLEHVLTTLTTSKIITSISIVTPDISVEQFVKKFSVSIIREEKSGYNQSLTYAAQKENKKEKLLSLPADLPFLTMKNIHEMYELSKNCDVVIAPSKDGGTNAILTQFPLQIPYLFGRNSFEKYKDEIRKRNLSVGIYESKTISFDVDTINDVKFYKEKLANE